MRGTVQALGHGVEATFLANLVLAAACLRRERLFPPLDAQEPIERSMERRLAQVAVTQWGHHRGEATALVGSGLAREGNMSAYGEKNRRHRRNRHRHHHLAWAAARRRIGSELSAGQSGIHRLTRFPIEGLNTTIGGSVDFMGLNTCSAPARSHAMAREAALEALAESGLDQDGAVSGRLVPRRAADRA